jgi:hypothetical protein
MVVRPRALVNSVVTTTVPSHGGWWRVLLQRNRRSLAVPELPVARLTDVALVDGSCSV